MTDKEFVKFIVEHKRLPREEDYYGGYGAAIISVFMVIGAIFMFYHGITLKQLNLILGGFALLVSAVLVFLLIKRSMDKRISLRIYKTGLSRKDNFRIAKDILTNDFKLKSLKSNEKYGLVSAQTSISGFGWGEDITIICGEEYVMMNSKTTSTATRTYTTIGKNESNIYKIKKGFETRKLQ
jgi:hypothetical protein